MDRYHKNTDGDEIAVAIATDVNNTTQSVAALLNWVRIYK